MNKENNELNNNIKIISKEELNKDNHINSHKNKIIRTIIWVVFLLICLLLIYVDSLFTKEEKQNELLITETNEEINNEGE